MKNLETYESFFKNLKNLFKKDATHSFGAFYKNLKYGKVTPDEPHPVDDERYMTKERKNEITDTIVDCLQDIFDEYSIYNSNGKKWHNVMMWSYINCESSRVGIEIYNIRQMSYDNLLDDITDKKDMLESMCGVKVRIDDWGGGFEYGEKDSDATIQITFPFHEQSSYDVQKERAKMGWK